jgi:hypothetical protein
VSLARRTPLRSRRGWTATDNGSRRTSGGNSTWRILRERCRDRAGGRCQAQVPDVCEGRGVHAHHLLRRGQGGLDELDNLAWLCGSCHGHVHRRVAWSYTVGLLRRRTDPGPFPWAPDTGRPACGWWACRYPERPPVPVLTAFDPKCSKCNLVLEAVEKLAGGAVAMEERSPGGVELGRGRNVATRLRQARNRRDRPDDDR